MSDFATFLDEAIAAAEAERPASVRPSIPFDILQAGDDAGGGPVRASEAIAAAEYLFSTVAGITTPEPEGPAMMEPPPTDALSIARELGLTGREKPEALDRMRRDFAFANHPDRVAADLRDGAIVRMQIANRMIDEAKQRLAKA